MYRLEEISIIIPAALKAASKQLISLSVADCL